MKELVDHSADHPRDLVPMVLRQARQAVLQPQQFRTHNVGGPLSQRRHGGDDLGDTLAGEVVGDLGADDPAGRLGVGDSGLRGRLPLHTFHVDHRDAGQPGHRRIDVPGHTEVAEHQRRGGVFAGFFAKLGGQRPVHIGQRHHRAHRSGAADDDVRLGHGDRQLVQGAGLGEHTVLGDRAGQSLRTRQRPVHDGDPPHSRPNQMRGRQGAHRTGADHRGGSPRQGVAAELGCGDVQRDGHHARARGVDRGLGVHPLADRQRPLDEVVQDPTH